LNKAFISLGLMLACLQGIAQEKLAWDSSYRPGNYHSRVENFRSYPDSREDIVFLGNSITHYAEWQELLKLPQARNRGISGDISFGVLERLDEISAGFPQKVFILIGINDIARNIPDSVILCNYRRIINRLRSESPGTRIYFQSLLPVNDSFPARNHFGKDEHIAAVNTGLASICREMQVEFIDIHSAFLDANKKLDRKFTYDGLHLNAAGYVHWAEILKSYTMK
jgi:lysophospholipase L1-like esterase